MNGGHISAKPSNARHECRPSLPLAYSCSVVCAAEITRGKGKDKSTAVDRCGLSTRTAKPVDIDSPKLSSNVGIAVSEALLDSDIVSWFYVSSMVPQVNDRIRRCL